MPSMRYGGDEGERAVRTAVAGGPPNHNVAPVRAFSIIGSTHPVHLGARRTLAPFPRRVLTLAGAR